MSTTPQNEELDIATAIKLLKAENTDKGKKEILKQCDWFARWVLKQTYDTFIKYGIKQIPLYTPLTTTSLDSIGQQQYILDTLQDIESKGISGNALSNLIQAVLNNLTQEYCDILIGILIKNQYIDCGQKLLLSAFGNDFLFLAPYMRCKTEADIHRITYPAKIDLKLDGSFVNVIIKPAQQQVLFMSRNGNLINLPSLGQKVLQLCQTKGVTRNIVLTGEMMIHASSADNRSDGNGTINSLLQRESTTASFEKKIATAKTEYAKNKLVEDFKNKQQEWIDAEEKAYIVCWDLIEYQGWVDGLDQTIMMDRFAKLQNLIDDSCDILLIAEWTIVNSEKEARQFFALQRDKGLEGCVLKQITPTKDITTYWKDHTNPGQVKLKGLFVIEMKCVDFSYSDENTNFKGFIGNLVCETSCELFTAKISGLTYADKGILVDEENQSIFDEDGNFQLNSEFTSITEYFENTFKDKIISVQFNDVSIDKNGKPSLQFAQYKGIRYDKNSYDTLQYILEITGKTDKVTL